MSIPDNITAAALAMFSAGFVLGFFFACWLLTTGQT
jgi:hypothetical protein